MPASKSKKAKTSKKKTAKKATKKAVKKNPKKPAKTCKKKGAKAQKENGVRSPRDKNPEEMKAKTPQKKVVRKDPDLEVDQEVLAFISALDEYKKKHNRLFPSNSEILQVLKELGYRKG